MEDVSLQLQKPKCSFVTSQEELLKEIVTRYGCGNVTAEEMTSISNMERELTEVRAYDPDALESHRDSVT